MSRFYVGQRVRIVGSFNDSDPYLLPFPDVRGKEGTVVGILKRADTWPEDWDVICYRVDVDGYPGHDKGYVREEHIAPATDSYDVTTWDSCVWQPEHLRLGV